MAPAAPGLDDALRGRGARGDVGVTLALLRLGPVALPGLLAGLVRAGRSAFVAAYRGAYARQRALDEDAVRVRGAALPRDPARGERAPAGACEVPRPSKPTAFGAGAVERVVARFHALTGVRVVPP